MRLVNLKDEETLDKRWTRINELFDDLSTLFLRWKAGKMIRHLDVDLLERVITERNELDQQLMIAEETIQVLNNKLKENELLLKHFTAEDAEVIRQRVQARLHDQAQLEMEEMPKVLSE